ncbi:MAG: FKBP-type peptidyl-prolyl cis-trans isomerase [Bacteroidales bacterium]|jgi:FKBP-type peptidyl-prolyl cis-trans isomerase|nr:FKBP-type peptidyl-prolyl cis-trans isomerase [Bacteroidales bacterium]
MFRKYLETLIIATAAVSLLSCAKEKEVSNDSVQKSILDAYLEKNDPYASVTSDGLAILSEKEGTGEQLKNYNACFIRYSTKTLDGTYQSTTYADLAKKLGTYYVSKYYGTTFFQVGYGTTYVGMEEALLRMKEGGRATVIIPPWLSHYKGNSSRGSSVNLIYELELVNAISNIKTFEIDSIEKWKNKNYYGVDSTAYGFYFKKISGTATDTIESSKLAYVWYVGRLLDGYVFNTNIEDTAKKYGIYNPKGSYNPIAVTYESTYSSVYSNLGSASSSSSSGSDYDVLGFARALKMMKYGDHAVSFFYYAYGKGASGSLSGGTGIPEFASMYFDIYVKETNKYED